MKKRKLAAATVNEDGTSQQLEEEGKDEDEGEDDE